MTESQAVEKVTPGQVAFLSEPVELDAEAALVMAIFTGKVEYEPEAADVDEITEEIFARAARAETEEELHKETTTWSSKDAIDEIFIFGPRGRYWPGKHLNQKTGRKQPFLAIEAVHEQSGEVGIFNSSSPRIAAKLNWYARQPNGMPIRQRVVVRGETSEGNPVLDLEKP